MFRKAILAVSFRESRSKLEGVINHISSFGTEELLLLHVAEGLHRGSAKSRIDALVEELPRAGMKVEGEVLRGSPATAVSREAKRQNANLICVPWKRKNWIQRSLLGSTTQDLIRLSNHPVFVYKEQRAGSEEQERLAILYATALQERDKTILPYLSYEGLDARRLVLLHVGHRAPDPSAEEKREREVNAKLRRLAQEVEQGEREVEVMSLTGTAKTRIPKVASRESVDMIVLGKSEGEGFISEVLGSTAEHVAYKAAQSLLIIGGNAPV